MKEPNPPQYCDYAFRRYSVTLEPLSLNLNFHYHCLLSHLNFSLLSNRRPRFPPRQLPILQVIFHFYRLLSLVLYVFEPQYVPHLA